MAMPTFADGAVLYAADLNKLSAWINENIHEGTTDPTGILTLETGFTVSTFYAQRMPGGFAFISAVIVGPIGTSQNVTLGQVTNAWLPAATFAMGAALNIGGTSTAGTVMISPVNNNVQIIRSESSNKTSVRFTITYALENA